ncbi:transporter substrate-binding domain-containing protein [Parabacteroides bouchesdurhonensis]|uniref:transporter substrate-binding domain-containing protein n=1 Tax=Parabacteroides bouchesdurhonensis TaxID=1936995 RepID=UPI000E4E3126|nr:transporter substrate-binding domain-containing protein [Parabacteroides bouchesdurhonensis]RHJ94897.1 glutamine ABC transporter substrate-binding protein [Bacteroides sp. AM07-16]
MRTKKLLILYIALLAIAVSTMIMLWKHPLHEIPPRDYEQIKEEGVLRMVTEYNQSGYYVAGDTIEGFQYELSQAIAKLSGLEVQTHLEMSLAKSFEDLSGNKYDVIARNIPATSEIKEEYLFTDPIVLNKQVLVQRTAKANDGKQPIRNQLDLAKKTLYIPKDSPALLRLHNLEIEIGDSIYVIEDELYSSEQLAIMVAKGDIDYAVCDQQIARLSQKQLPELDIDTDISFTQLQSWAVRKDSPVLLDSLNSWLNQIRESGLYNKIYERYYGKRK